MFCLSLLMPSGGLACRGGFFLLEVVFFFFTRTFLVIFLGCSFG